MWGSLRLAPISSKCLTKKLKSSRTCLIGYSGFIKGFYNSRGGHTHAHIPTSRTKAHAWFNKTINTAHNSTFLRMDKSAVPSSTSGSTFNNLMQNTQTTWCFLIKVPYLGKLSVIPYRGKHWRGETLANLASDHKFAKV